MKNIYIKIIGYLCAVFMALPLFGMELASSKKPVITGKFRLDKRLGFAYATQNYQINKLGRNDSNAFIPIAFIKIILDEKPDVADYDKFYDDNHQTLKEQNIEKCLLSDFIQNEQLIQNGSTIVRKYPQFTLKLQLQDSSFENKYLAMINAFKDRVDIIGDEDEEYEQELIKAGVIEDNNGYLNHRAGSYLNYLNGLGLLGGKREEWVATGYEINDFFNRTEVAITVKHGLETKNISYLVTDFTPAASWDDLGYPNAIFIMDQGMQEQLQEGLNFYQPIIYENDLKDGDDDTLFDVGTNDKLELWNVESYEINNGRVYFVIRSMVNSDRLDTISYSLEDFQAVAEWVDGNEHEARCMLRMSQDIQKQLAQEIKQLYPLEDGNDDSGSFIIVKQNDDNDLVSEDSDNDLTLSSESESSSEENTQKVGSSVLKYLLPTVGVAAGLMYLMYAKSPQFRQGVHYYLGLIMRMVR